jgi:hypothetical protein
MIHLINFSVSGSFDRPKAIGSPYTYLSAQYIVGHFIDLLVKSLGVLLITSLSQLMSWFILLIYLYTSEGVYLL